MWPYYYKRFGDLKLSANFERCFAAMLSYKHIAHLHPDPSPIRQEFEQGAPTYTRLFALFLTHYAERQGKRRWGDQAVLLERYTEAIFEGYPTAKIIHMIRDPRDRFHAARSRSLSSLPQIGEATARWLYSARMGIRNIQHFREQYLVIRFEDLVTTPEETLRRICAFIGEEYEPSMMTMEMAPAFRKKLGEDPIAPTASPLDPAFIGQYFDHLSDKEIHFIQNICMQEMEEFSYSLHSVQEEETIPFIPAEKITSTIYQRGRMIGWLIQEKLRTRWPVIFGRSPAKREWLTQPQEKNYRAGTT
jgi:hypothetical protein